jgi:hypothetical protein
VQIQESDVTLNIDYVDQFPPLPIHWGVECLQDNRDFVLPFDIVYEWERGDLGGKKVPTKYTKIKKSEC